MIHQLNTNDFIEKKTVHGKKSIHLDRSGAWFVFFSSTNCPHCNSFKDKYHLLAQDDKKVNYGSCIANEGGGNSVAGKMRGSSTQINNVPHFLLYIDGKPKAVYSGPREPAPIKEFNNVFLKKHSSEAASLRPASKKPPVVKRDLTVSKEYYPEGYRAGENPDMGKFQGHKLTLPPGIRPHNEPYRHSGR